jgi:hypothetical protein
MRVAELTLSSFCDETMSEAHLKRGAFSTGEKHCVRAPSFKTIFDWRREKGLGMSQNQKLGFLLLFFEKISLQSKS